MELSFIKENLGNPAKLVPEIINKKPNHFKASKFKQYDPKNHKVMQKEHRNDKTVYIPDPSGAINDKTGGPAMIATSVPVSRISVPMQKLITSRANAFMTAGPVIFKANPNDAKEEETFRIFNEIWKNAKCKFINSEIGKTLLSETEVAEIWHTRKNEDGSFEMKCKVYKPSDGYELIPIFDRYRDMVAFAVKYCTKSSDDKVTEHLQLYTKDLLRMYEKSEATGNEWRSVKETLNDEGEVDKVVPLVYGKIPVIYYCIKNSVWEDVQPMIERLETLLSNFADTNDYNGSPILFTTGTIKGMSAKGESGKLIEGEGDADLKYVTWEHAPTSIKLEIEKLIELIYTCTQTANLSFEALKGIGKISGVAFDRMLIDAHLKAKDMHTGPYGEGVQRRCNFLVKAISELYKNTSPELEITPEFELFRIDDNADRVDWLLKANGGLPVMTWEESVVAARLSDDPKKSFETLKEAQMVDAQGESFIEGDTVKVKPGMESDPSHVGVVFTVNGFVTETDGSTYVSLTSTDSLTGSLKYPAESLVKSI